jgi:hypothetical protein
MVSEINKVEGKIRGKFRGGEIVPSLIIKNEIEPTKLDLNVPFYRQDGFKRGIGCFLMIAGAITEIFHPVGKAITYAGGGIGGFGLLHAKMKSKPAHGGNKGFSYWLGELLKIIMELIKKGK